jgi:hypothetical protein
MLRAVLSLVGILASVAALVWCFGYTTPQVTSILPVLNRSVAHTVELMQHNSSPEDREANGVGPGGTPASSSAPANPSTASTANAPTPPPAAPSTPASTPEPPEAEIIGPDSTAHLNPDHIRDINQPTPGWTAPSGDGAQGFNPNPAAFVPPHPLPSHPHWTWDVGNREFTNVVVTRVDADIVTIAADSGAAQIDIALLPGEIQHELHYDPVFAAEAAAARKNQAAAVTAGSH